MAPDSNFRSLNPDLSTTVSSDYFQDFICSLLLDNWEMKNYQLTKFLGTPPMAYVLRPLQS